MSPDEFERRRQKKVEEEWLRRSGEWEAQRRMPLSEKILLGIALGIGVVALIAMLWYSIYMNS